MSMMVSFVLSFFPRDVLDEILNLIESVSEDFPSYSYISLTPNIYLISLVFSESGRLSFANGIDATHKEELYLRRVLH